MSQATQQHLIKALAISATGMVCLTRISMALGEVFNGIVLLLGIILFYQMRKEIEIPEEVKGYVRAYLIFVLSTFLLHYWEAIFLKACMSFCKCGFGDLSCFFQS